MCVIYSLHFVAGLATYLLKYGNKWMESSLLMKRERFPVYHT